MSGKMRNVIGGAVLATLAGTFSAAASDGQNTDAQMTPERQAVLNEVEALNDTATGKYLRDNGIGMFAERSMSRSGEMFKDGRYLGEAAVVLNQGHPDFKGIEDPNEAINIYSTTLAYGVCNLVGMDASNPREQHAQDMATNFMALRAHSETLFEETFEEFEPVLSELRDGDYSVCGEVKQRYKTLGID